MVVGCGFVVLTYDAGLPVVLAYDEVEGAVAAAAGLAVVGEAKRQGLFVAAALMPCEFPREGGGAGE